MHLALKQNVLYFCVQPLVFEVTSHSNREIVLLFANCHWFRLTTPAAWSFTAIVLMLSDQ
jgi:hypothetical protein